MTALPFTQLERGALELNCPAAAIGMNDKDIGDAIGLGQPLLQRDRSLGKLFTQPVRKDHLPARVPYRLSLCAPGTFASLMSKVKLSALPWATAHMQYPPAIRTKKHTF